MTPILLSTPLKSLSPARLTSAEPELDAIGTARVAPVDRVLPDVLAHDGTGAELDAPFRIVNECALLEVVDLGGTHIQARLCLARATHVRVDRDERLLVKLEPVQAHALVDGQGLRSVRLRGFRHKEHRRNREPVIKGWWPVDGHVIRGGNQGETFYRIGPASPRSSGAILRRKGFSPCPRETGRIRRSIWPKTCRPSLLTERRNSLPRPWNPTRAPACSASRRSRRSSSARRRSCTSNASSSRRLAEPRRASCTSPANGA